MHGPSNFDSGNRSLRNTNLKMTTVTPSHPVNISLCLHFFIFPLYPFFFFFQPEDSTNSFLPTYLFCFLVFCSFSTCSHDFFFFFFFLCSLFSQCFLILFLNLNFSIFLHLISFFFFQIIACGILCLLSLHRNL